MLTVTWAYESSSSSSYWEVDMGQEESVVSIPMFVIHTFLFWIFFFSSLRWQHQQCPNPRPSPTFHTLYTDHTCPTDGARGPAPRNVQLMGPPNPRAETLPPMDSHSVRRGVLLPSLCSLLSTNVELPFYYYYYYYLIQPLPLVVSPSASATQRWMAIANPPLPHAAAAAQVPSGLLQPQSAGAPQMQPPLFFKFLVSGDLEDCRDYILNKFHCRSYFL